MTREFRALLEQMTEEKIRADAQLAFDTVFVPRLEQLRYATCSEQADWMRLAMSDIDSRYLRAPVTTGHSVIVVNGIIIDTWEPNDGVPVLKVYCVGEGVLDG
jgi:hypothetical protein